MGSSHKTCDLSGDERRASAEALKRRGEGRVAFVRRSEERVVGRALLRLLPDTLDGIELRGVRGQAEQVKTSAVGREPRFAIRVAVMARTVVDHEEYFPSRPAHEQLEEREERLRSEDGSELIVEPRPHLQRQRAEEMGGLAHAERVDPGLHADTSPCLVERTVEPETGFVPVHDNAAAGGGFFLMRGSVFRSHTVWASASARAKRRRGRCTEKPSSCSSRGT